MRVVLDQKYDAKPGVGEVTAERVAVWVDRVRFEFNVITDKGTLTLNVYSDEPFDVRPIVGNVVLLVPRRT